MSDSATVDQSAIYRKLRRNAFYYDYRTGPVVLPSSGVESENKQRQSKMLSIDGVMESWRRGREECFEAAVQTDDGPKNLEGRVVSRPSADIQSGSVAGWQTELQEVDHAIRNAYDTLVPIKAVSAIWEQLDRTRELAAARSRLLLGKLGKPKLAPLPDWFKNQRDNLIVADEDELTANPRAVTVAELIVCAVAATVPNLTAEIETGPMGRVVIDWHVPKGRLQWMVESMDTPWPSAKVYQVSQETEPTSVNTLKTRIFYNAFDAIESLVQFLNDN